MRQLFLFLTAFLTLTVSSLFGQTAITENKYKLSFTDKVTCFAESWDITFPHLLSTQDKDIRSIVNDTIVAMVKSNFKFSGVDGSCGFNFDVIRTDSNACDNISLIETTVSMNYRVVQNSKIILSILINFHQENAGGGHGSSLSDICFNLDLLNNQLISIDSLFSSDKDEEAEEVSNKEKVLKLLKAKTETDTVSGYNYNEDLKFVDITISKQNLIAHYNVNLAASHYSTYYIELPLADIKKYINKKYLWLCETEKKKK